jgi:hypothetical protein
MEGFISNLKNLMSPMKVSSIHHPSSILYPLSSILYPLSSILYPLSSILYPLSSILYPLSSILPALSLHISFTSWSSLQCLCFGKGV